MATWLQRKHLEQWLVENIPSGTNLVFPRNCESRWEVPGWPHSIQRQSELGQIGKLFRPVSRQPASPIYPPAGYDYAQAGAYFVTIVVQGRACLFGEVVDGEVHLNDTGRLVSACWQWLESQYPFVELYEFVVMPNHLHGIIVISDGTRRGGSRTAPTGADSPAIKRKPLGRLIGAFKTVSTKRFNREHGLSGTPLWQRDYFEHVIRSEESLAKIRRYIHDNPARWEFDRENPAMAPQVAEGP